jgi:glycosyltransferase involved in cell wall biosynthesis
MRYAWDQFDAYFGPDRVGKVGNQILRPILAGLARWDRATEGRVHRYLAISQYVARRIAVYYNRQSTLVYPPVDTEFYKPDPVVSAPSAKFVVVSALVPYKRVDLAMMAARQAGVALTVVGTGPERANLEKLTGNGIELAGWRADEEIRDIYRNSIAAILPGEEDFGIVPVEAQACGRPVVALGRAGALDTVIDGETGVLFDEPTVDSLAAALTRTVNTTWDASRIRAHAERFSRARFANEIRQIVDDTVSAPAGQRW